MYCFSIFGTICIFKRASCASCSGVRAALGSVSFASLSWPGREGGDQPSSLWVPLLETFRVSLKLDSLRMGDLVSYKNLVDAARQLRIFSTDGNSMISYICSIDLLCLTGTLMMMVKRWYWRGGIPRVPSVRSPASSANFPDHVRCLERWDSKMPKISFNLKSYEV